MFKIGIPLRLVGTRNADGAYVNDYEGSSGFAWPEHSFECVQITEIHILREQTEDSRIQEEKINGNELDKVVITIVEIIVRDCHEIRYEFDKIR